MPAATSARTPRSYRSRLATIAARSFGGEAVDLEVRRRALHFVHQAEDVGLRERVQSAPDRPSAAPGRRERRHEAVERAVLAEVEQLVLAAEIVIEVAGRQIGGDGNLAHAGGGEAAGAEDLRRGAEDLDPPCVGAAAGPIGLARTAVRRVNHRSILKRSGLAFKHGQAGRGWRGRRHETVWRGSSDPRPPEELGPRRGVVLS